MTSQSANSHTKLLIIALTALLVTACSSGSKHVSKADLSAAEQMGRQRAMEFAPTADLDTLQIEERLLDIRAREHHLRQEGYNSVADAYIKAFTTTLDSINPDLAAKLR
jgi:hypothetical protein